MLRAEREVRKMPSTDKKQNRLQKSLALIFVYTVATGSIFTYVSYWDSVFFSYCGPGTFLAFALMTLAILPIALVYSEISPLFHTAGGELIYNTVGFNRHVGFLASWLINGCLDLGSPRLLSWRLSPLSAAPLVWGSPSDIP